jgi:3-oxoacyl-[acyl-carrier-protein] synthase-1
MRAGWLLSDLTFEDWRAREWQAVYVRAAHVLGPPHCIDNPAQRLGHLGVAALPLSLVLVAEANRHGHAPSPLALTMASSDDGARTAMLLAAP